MRIDRLLFSLALLGLAACSRPPASPPSAQTLMLRQEQFPAIASIETVVEIGAAPGQGTSPDIEALRQAGMQSIGRYRYHLGVPDGGVYKVYIMLFADEAAAIRNWQQRHHPEALAQTQPLDLIGRGEGWIYPSPGKGEMAELRVGRVVVEIKARGAAGRLAGFCQALARHADRQLRR